MRTVLAALDCSAADRPVIETALGVAELLGASVKAVHVGEGPAVTAEGAASMAGGPLQLLAGPVAKTLLAELHAPEVAAGVLGARGVPMGRRPAGGTVLEVLEHTDKPVVVVPPEAYGVCARPPFDTFGAQNLTSAFTTDGSRSVSPAWTCKQANEASMPGAEHAASTFRAHPGRRLSARRLAMRPASPRAATPP